MTVFPPQRTYRPIPLSSAQAHLWLSTYLDSCASTALLQPDALLTPSGPVQSQGMSSVTIHNLKRLQAGLNGKYDVRPVATEARENRHKDNQFKGAVVNVDELYTADEEWQDKSEFEREQSEEMGETGDRDPSHGEAGNKDSPIVDTTQAVSKKARRNVEKNSSTKGKGQDSGKRSRKAEKKARKKKYMAEVRNRDKD